MRTSALSASILGLALAGNINSTPAVESDDRQVLEFVSNRFAEMESLVAEPRDHSRKGRLHRPAGLQTASLHAGSLQPSSGLDSLASGLTPEAEWCRMFPRKKQ